MDPVTENSGEATPEQQICEALSQGQVEKASKILLDLLETELKQGREELRIFAEHYGPMTARIAVRKKIAIDTGNTIAAEEADLDLQEIVAQAKMKAALFGLRLQNQGENLVGTVMGAAFGALVKLI